MPIRRTLKNVVKNYSEAQIKVREATSNDAWGPSTTLMSEIADLTYNVVAYAEIMPILWRRLEDSGRNWRHVYKSLVLLDYLVRNGSERVARECRERAWAIKAIADSFDFADGADNSGQDRGVGVRERARALTALLRDDDRLRNERAKALKARERFAQNSSALSATTVSGATSSGLSTGTKYSLRSISPLHSGSMFSESAAAGGYSEFGSPSLSSLEASQYGLEGGTGTALESELEALRPTSSGEEELQLQLALAMSKEEHEEEQRRLKGDEAKLQMALDESRKQAPLPSTSPLHTDSRLRPSSRNADLLSSLKDFNDASDQWVLPPGSSTPESRLKSLALPMMPSPWLPTPTNPPILPPPPSKLSQPQQQTVSEMGATSATVCIDPWLSDSSDNNSGAWGAQHSKTPVALTAAAANGSSPWESPIHSFASTKSAVPAAMFDDEFDVIGSRSRSPVIAASHGIPPLIPPRQPLTGGEGSTVGDPWDLSLVDQALDQEHLHANVAYQASSFGTYSLQSQTGIKKSPHDFLGDNANLVNLDGLFSQPASGAMNPFGSSTSRSSSPAVSMATNPFGLPPLIPTLSSSATVGNTGLSLHHDTPAPAVMVTYPQAYNPFL